MDGGDRHRGLDAVIVSGSLGGDPVWWRSRV